MADEKKLHGAAAFTHALKEYGGGKSMVEGVKRIARESRDQGRLEGVILTIRTLIARLFAQNSRSRK